MAPIQNLLQIVYRANYNREACKRKGLQKIKNFQLTLYHMRIYKERGEDGFLQPSPPLFWRDTILCFSVNTNYGVVLLKLQLLATMYLLQCSDSYLRMIRTAFKIASTATPTSANTAIHIEAKPTAPKINTSSLMIRINVIFCFTMRRV